MSKQREKNLLQAQTDNRSVRKYYWSTFAENCITTLKRKRFGPLKILYFFSIWDLLQRHKWQRKFGNFFVLQSRRKCMSLSMFLVCMSIQTRRTVYEIWMRVRIFLVVFSHFSTLSWTFDDIYFCEKLTRKEEKIW